MDRPIAATMNRPRWLIAPAMALVVLVVAWLHYLFVVTPLDFADKDFMSLWTGARALLEGLNPYDEAVWQPLRAAYGSNWMPDPRAPFPLWTFILMLPFALLPIPAAAALWLTVQELLFVLSALIVARLFTRRTLTAVEIGLVGLVGFVSVPMILVLINGQMTFLLLFLLALFLLFLERDRPLLAGMALALLAIKPNPFIALIPLLGLWLIWRKEWRVILGGAAAACMLLATVAIQPGWISQWFNVRSKTEVVTITPTVWGLAAELAGPWWAPAGFILVIATLAVTGWFVFSRPQQSAAWVVNVGLAAALLVTPYTWAYEHALLFLPWLSSFVWLRSRRQAAALWLLMAGLIPWLVFSIAIVRRNDSLGFIVPLATLGLLLWLATRSPAEMFLAPQRAANAEQSATRRFPD